MLLLAATTIAFANGVNWYALAASIVLMVFVLVGWWMIERKSDRQ